MIRNRTQPPLVLVVDDDAGLRLLARHALEQAGFAVIEAEDGPEALDLVQQRRPTLVLLDVRMPRVDGYTVCQELRKRRPTEHTAVVMLTGLDDAESIDAAFEAGATDFVTKPINWPLLVHRVRHIIRTAEVAKGFRDNQFFLASAQRAARLGSWEWNTETGEMQWSDEMFRILGLDPREVAPAHEWFEKSSHPDDRALLRERIDEALRVTGSFEVEHRIQLPDGRERFVCLLGEIISDAESGGSRVMGTLQDVTEKRQAQERNRYLANYDSLTGLSNRRLFREQLSRAIGAAKRKGHFMGLLYLDFDRFKAINDEFGHATGDAVLRVVADRLREQVRGSDTVARIHEARIESEVSRLGGDEFAVILSKIVSESNAADVSARVLEALNRPISIGERSLSIASSIGIAVFPGDGDDAESLVSAADAAMYEAKQLGGCRYRFFSPALNEARVRKLTIESGLREALGRQEFQCFYQPKVDLRSGRVSGMEALLRWQHPELGSVVPSEFIPIAEKTGLIDPIGAWAIETACAQTRAWHEMGHESLRIAVNISVRQFRQENLLDSIVRILKRTGLEPPKLELEITESLMIENFADILDLLCELRAMGIRIALDDFGTGYSSLSYLTRLPLDTLKLDRCFVRDIGVDSGSEAVIQLVLSVAKKLGMEVVAEGVESEAQVDFLREHGCDALQGFLFSPAVPADEFVPLLAPARASEEKGRPAL